jgi:hypothetical protein
MKSSSIFSSSCPVMFSLVLSSLFSSIFQMVRDFDDPDCLRSHNKYITKRFNMRVI